MGSVKSIRRQSSFVSNVVLSTGDSNITWIDTARGAAGRKRFRVVERRDVRFTEVETEVDIAQRVFPVREDLRKILSEPAAGAYYMQFYLRTFIERHTLRDALAYVQHPPSEVRAATEAFLEEAETGVAPKGVAGETSVPPPVDLIGDTIHGALRSSPIPSGRSPPYVTKIEIGGLTEIPGSRRHSDTNSKRKVPSKWSAVVAAAVRLPELMFVTEDKQRVYFLDVATQKYDELFADFGLPSWRSTFWSWDVQ